MEAPAVAVVDEMPSCGCCLRRAPDRDLTTPYTYLGKTEIYSDMLKECFDIHLGVGGAGECGICAACVGRLRDASDFKLQVQCSQAELQARLQGALRVKEEEPAVESGNDDGDRTSVEPVLDEEPPVKPVEADEEGIEETLYQVLESETLAGDRTSDDDPLSIEERAVRPEVSDDAASDEDYILLVRPDSTAWVVALAATRQQLGMSCSVRLERLRGDEAPHASRTSLADNTAGLRAEPAYTCDMCSQQFTAKYNLKRHIITHMRQKSHLCVVCNTMFKQSCGLKQHQRIHTGEKPFSCVYCNKRFNQKHCLEDHKRIHTGEKPFSCVDCNKQFTQRSSLIGHKRIHTGEKPFSCLVCSKRFALSCNLVRHKRMHTGEKLYGCVVCNKQFTQKSTLDSHIILHTKNKPCSCVDCNKQFAKPGYLLQHKKYCKKRITT